VTELEPKVSEQEKKSMNNKFDELTKSMAQSINRRQAFKKFSVGLTGMALACFGLADKAEAAKGGCKPGGSFCQHNSECCSGKCFIFPGKAGTCTA